MVYFLAWVSLVRVIVVLMVVLLQSSCVRVLERVTIVWVLSEGLLSTDLPSPRLSRSTCRFQPSRFAASCSNSFQEYFSGYQQRAKSCKGRVPGSAVSPRYASALSARRLQALSFPSVCRQEPRTHTELRSMYGIHHQHTAGKLSACRRRALSALA